MTDTRSTVLVIDDEPDMAEMIAFCLTYRGYSVTTTTCGSIAVEMVRNQHFDLAICDLKMPGWDGLQTTRALKQARPGLPVIIATGYATDDTMKTCLAEGASDCIRKPFTADELDRLMRRVLAQSDHRKSAGTVGGP